MERGGRELLSGDWRRISEGRRDASLLAVMIEVVVKVLWQMGSRQKGCTGSVGRLARNGEWLTIIRVGQTSLMEALAAIIARLEPVHRRCW